MLALTVGLTLPDQRGPESGITATGQLTSVVQTYNHSWLSPFTAFCWALKWGYKHDKYDGFISINCFIGISYLITMQSSTHWTHCSHYNLNSTLIILNSSDSTLTTSYFLTWISHSQYNMIPIFNSPTLIQFYTSNFSFSLPYLHSYIIPLLFCYSTLTISSI